MNDAMSHGQPFGADELWRPSIFTTSFAPSKNDLFSPSDLDLNLSTLHLGRDSDVEDAHFRFESSLQLDLPADEDDLPPSQPVASDGFPSDAATQDPAIPEPTDDIWNLDAELCAPSSPPQFRTWATFGGTQTADVSDPIYLSEAGASAFDAALSQSQPAGFNGVLPHDVSLRAMCNLVLGRSSIFFHWNASKGCFEETLRDTPVSGLSLPCSASFSAALMDYASMYRRLLADVASYSIGKTRTVTELKRCVTEIMDAVERFLSDSLPAIRSMLQLQATVQTPRLLVTYLTELLESVKDIGTEEEVLSILADQVYMTAESGSELTEVLQAVLARISHPWLQSLREDLGLTDELAFPTGALADEDTILDSSDLDQSSDDVVPQGRLQSRLIGEGDRRLIANTRSSLRIARKHLDSSFTAAAYASMTGQDDRSVAGAAPTSKFNTEYDGGVLEHDAWADEEAQHHYLENLDACINRKPEPNGTSDTLNSVTIALLRGAGAPKETNDIELKSSTGFDPLAELRPVIQTQWRGLNHRILRHVFEVCELREHLATQRSFYLLGSGDFVARLSTALFSANTQPAERTRGTVPTGEIMGLRLDAREGQKWPPASYELRLSLMGVLSEAYYSDISRAEEGAPPDLPANLSFAIRELSETDIDRVTDPTSLHALDFLKLQYAAPAPLDVILTPASTQRYDEIFRFLLQLLRVLDVTTRLREQALSTHQQEDCTVYRVSLELHHVVATIVGFVMNIGIDVPWRTFMRQVDNVEDAMRKRRDSSTGSIDIGIRDLRKMHDVCLESIRTRLFLKRKHVKIRDAIEEIFTSTLDAALAVGKTGKSSQQSMSRFTASVTQLTSLLQETIDKPSKAAESEREMLEVLLAQLNWNHFYFGDTLRRP